ncbi:hypothetical protein FQN49_007462 [Arthroderma sp. PD_2]|nr:hypothetical protein FQN49_007462 [Arthroderma sp. PD_2]
MRSYTLVSLLAATIAAIPTPAETPSGLHISKTLILAQCGTNGPESVVCCKSLEFAQIPIYNDFTQSFRKELQGQQCYLANADEACDGEIVCCKLGEEGEPSTCLYYIEPILVPKQAQWE